MKIIGIITDFGYDSPYVRSVKSQKREESIIKGHAVIKDKFGNLLTNIPNEWITENKRYILKIKNFEIRGLFKTYYF